MKFLEIENQSSGKLHGHQVLRSCVVICDVSNDFCYPEYSEFSIISLVQLVNVKFGEIK
jgi:hypothetical protein